jgi:hypothetical protein
MSLSAQQFEELTDALGGDQGAAFDHDTLEQMVEFKLGKTLYALVPRDKPLRTVAFELIKVAEQEGWTDALVRAAYNARPNNARVKAFVDKYWPQAKVPEEFAQQVRAVKTGLEALAAILQRLTDPSIRQTIGGFSAVFKLTLEKIDTLKRYKGLHAYLHQLNTKYVPALNAAAKYYRQDQTQFELLQSYATQLQSEAGRIRLVALGLPSYPVENDWIDSLEKASARVLKSLDDTNDVNVQLGLNALRRVLIEEPPRINGLLCAAADDLHLEKLIRAMRVIEGYLAKPSGAGNGSLPAQDFHTGLSSLLLLQPRLAGLVQEHYAWQWLEREFTAADVLTAAVTPETRFPRWEDFKKRLLDLCDLAQAKDWSQSLRELIGQLEESGRAGDAKRFGRSYNTFHTLAADRFFNVDDEMLDLSEQLPTIGQPLDQLMRILTNGSP